MRRRIRIGIFTTLAILAGLLCGFSVTLYRTHYIICWNTASGKGFTEWPFGIRTSHWETESPLEEYMHAKHPGKVSHHWATLAVTGHNAFGQAHSFSDYRHDGIAPLRHSDLAVWMKGRSDSEIVKLYSDLSSHDRDRVEARIDEICFGDM